MEHISQSDILQLAQLLPKHEPHAGSSGSAFYTGAYRKGGIIGLRASCSAFPLSTEALTRYARQEQPNAIFSSLAILDNVQSGYHKDVANAHIDNYVFKLSNFSEGGVWCEDGQGTDVRLVNGQAISGKVIPFINNVLQLPAHKAVHATEPWSGSRVVLASYCLQCLEGLKPSAMQQLLQLGFQPNLATGDLHSCVEEASPLELASPVSSPSIPSKQRPLVLEICAGTAGISASLTAIGFDTIAIDHKRVPGAKAAIHIADLTSAHGLALAERFLRHPRCVGMWAAPVCGTASRAREIATVDGPLPLRSESMPDGLHNLSATDSQRVARANALYQAVSKLALIASECKLIVVIENPRRSLYWKTSFFTEIAHLCSFTAFQACAYGSRRDKWTALAYTRAHPAFAAINKACPGSPRKLQHLPWGYDTTAANGFATATESAYPKEFCDAIADVFRRLCPPEVPPPVLPLHQIQAAVGNQPKASRTPLLVPEHKQIVKLCLPASTPLPISLRARLKDAWPVPLIAHCTLHELPVGSQLLKVSSLPDKGGAPFQEVVWGLPWSSKEFVEQALAAGHPRALEVALPQVLNDAISQHKISSPAKIAKCRASFFAKWLKIANDLQAEECRLKDSMSEKRRRILQPKRLLVWEAMLKEANYSDMGVVEETIRGTDLVGEAPATGVFNSKFRPARRTIDNLKECAPAEREAVLQSVKSQGKDTDEAVLEQTLAEVSKGWASGPLDLCQLPPHAVISRRFGLVQPGKIRLIDDLSASGINDTVQAEEFPTPHAVDVAAGMCAATMRQLHGRPHKGRAYDLASAYRQLAVSDATSWASFVAIWDHMAKGVSVFELHALPFGASRSVFSFLRAMHSVWHLGSFHLWLIWSCYYDDLISIAESEHSDFTHRTIDAFFTLLGWAYAKEGKKCQAYSESFSALGVCFVIADMHLGRIVICNTEKRIQQLREAIKGYLARGSMSVTEAMKLRGQMQFASGQILGRQFKSCLTALADYTYSSQAPILSPSCISALEEFKWMLEHATPREIRYNNQQPMFLFTDACYNPGNAWRCGIGAMLFNHLGHLVCGFSHQLSDHACSKLGADSQETIIMAAEFIAVSCAVETWKMRIANVPLILFIDNNSRRDVLISAKGRSPLMRKLLKHYLRVEYLTGFLPWIARVPSPSNCADDPSTTAKRGRPEDCQGLTAPEASKAKKGASAETGMPIKTPKRMMQTSLSSWQVPGDAGDLEAPRYLLTNRANYCYMNASAAALHWAMRVMCNRPSDFGSLGPALMAISRLKRLEIPTHPDWKVLLRGWRRPTQQHDAAEFMAHVVDPGATAIAGRWQARCLERGRSPVCEESSTAPHIGIDITAHNDLQSALDAWHQQHYTHALSTPPKLLCLQMGRFRHEGRRTVKVRHRCSVPSRLQVPVFAGELLECTTSTYALCSGIAHIGDTATSGHYRAMCIHSPSGQGRSEDSSPTLRYTLCDDDRQASQNSSRLGSLLDHNLYVVLYCRLDPEPGPPGRS